MPARGRGWEGAPMSAEPGIDEGLRLVRAESEALLAELRALDPADWRHPSNCPPWDVAMLVAHVAAAGYLLPTMLEVNLPVLYTRGARGRGRLRVVTREQPPRAWLIEADGETLAARPAADGDAPALKLGAGDLGLLFYGREPLATLLASGRAM